ncbi:hypothetical protein [Mesorhizobium sp.]
MPSSRASTAASGKLGVVTVDEALAHLNLVEKFGNALVALARPRIPK